MLFAVEITVVGGCVGINLAEVERKLDKLIQKIFIKKLLSTKTHIWHRKFPSAGGWKLGPYIGQVVIILFIYAAYSVVLINFKTKNHHSCVFLCS